MTPEEIKAMQEKMEQVEANAAALASKLAEAESRASASENKVQEVMKAQEEAVLTAAEGSGDLPKLLEIAKAKIDKLEADVKEKDDRDNQVREKVIKTKQVEAFKEALGAPLANDVYLRLVEWDKVIVDPSNKEGISFNKDGLSQVVETFKKTCPEAIVTENSGSMGAAASGGKQSDPAESFASRVAKAGLV